ncbi:MAG: hypothetical protein LAN64_15865 [Acidobacteriia bacterium]|nr:hypothetical protein [Terriglobia bacterium]
MPNVAGRAVGVGGNHPLVNLILMEDVYSPLFLDEVDPFNGYKASEQPEGERQRNVLA